MQTIIKFLKTIFLVDLMKGLWLTMKYTPQPAFTFQYPAERSHPRIPFPNLLLELRCRT